MTPLPTYTPQTIDSPAYHLRFTWTGWTSKGSFPAEPSKKFFQELQTLWESDGIRYLSSKWTKQQIQITVSVKPTVSPVFLASRVKGRLQHALRAAGTPVSFSRKVSVRSLGNNRRVPIEAYVANQVLKEAFLDDRFTEQMQEFTVSNQQISLQEPTKTASGRYWYNLHLVLVTDHRLRFTDSGSLQKIAEMCDRIAERKGYLVGSRSVMPDHIHLTLRGNIEHSTEKIALAFMNNIAYAFGQNAVLRPSYYAGTFGEYDMGAVRR
jgi:REP element-mobilizing transposase RayT